MEKKFNLKVFIETGTYYGDMVDGTKDIFKKIASIELDQTLYENAKQSFSKYDNIHAIQGGSGKLLPNVIKNIYEPCLFWLDPHY